MIPVDARGAMKSRATVDSSAAESSYKVYAGILLGEDLAFQAKEAGSNPTTRSKNLIEVSNE